MILFISGHGFQYEMEKLCRIFFPLKKIRVVFSNEFICSQDYIATCVSGGKIFILAKIGEVFKEYEQTDDMTGTEMQLARLLVRCLSDVTGIKPAWGVLTGIRPSKLMLNKVREAGREEAVKFFCEKYLTDQDKANLALQVAEREEKIIKKASKNSFCLYISIPFCPSRCEYCSFVSHSIEKTNDLIVKYVDALCKEIELAGKVVKETSLTLDAVYFGGGTPTTLDVNMLERVLKCVEDNFDLSHVLEYTVEAGRPDTVTEPKLECLRRHNVDRISINPQTLNDETLIRIGRKHTVKQFYKAFEIAKSLSFNSINSDLIAGLRDDSFESFKNSLDNIVKLSPDNITVHTLALKRSSYLVTENEKIGNDADAVLKMTRYASEKLSHNGYYPYYMYRQSKSLGNLENIGWCKKNKECAYNILMMEEVSTIIACGAGAVTKLKKTCSDKLERIFNFKYPYEYIARFNEIAERKEKIRDFFN